MTLLLGILLFSFIVTSIAIVPYINLLYKLRFQRHRRGTKDAFGKLTPIFDKFHHQKVGTPIGGGLLVIAVVSILFALMLPIIKLVGINVTQIHPINSEVNIIFLSFISFGLLGLYDDVMKFFMVDKTKFFGLRLRHKFIIQWLLGFFLAFMLYQQLHIDIVYVPFIGLFRVGWFYIPMAAFIIVSFANAVNITDGLDGLAAGLLMIALFAFWFLSNSILDTPLSVFIALWLGSLIAFLYFNVYPARIFMGDVGTLSFGATLAVVGLLLGKIMAVVVIGGIFVIELLSSLVQLTSKKYRGKKVFPVAPFHLWLQMIGWEEPKIVMRAWLAAIMLAVFGLWLAFI
jgi:phospho-N-acetylmuramoyl-pentapeptide-transferase